MEPPRFYRFGPFWLDTINHSLRRNNNPVALQPKTYEVLWMLIRNRDRVVTREELKNEIWGADVWVEESALGFQINQLRKALTDDTTDPQYIRTIPRRGFQFIADAIPVSEIEQPNKVVVGTPVEESSTPIDPRSGGAFSEAAESARLEMVIESRFGGHDLYVIAASAIYAAYFSIALLVEIAYEFDRYGETGRWVAILFGSLIFVSSLWALSVGLKRTSSGRGHGLLFSVSVFLIAAVAVVIAACWFLPAEPITKANFQTYTAQAAYFKDFCYIVPLGLLFLVVPLHFVVGVERDLRAQEGPLAINLLTGETPSAAPSGTVYLRTWFLLMLLIGMAAYSLPARRHLFDNLKPDPYMSLFQSLIHVRMILYFGLAMLCVAWYHRALNELKREAWQARTEVQV